MDKCIDSTKVESIPDVVKRLESLGADDIENARKSVNLMAVREKLKQMKSDPVSVLLETIKETESPLLLWAAHEALLSREVPPCLRHRRDETSQMVFITWLADLSWLAHRYPKHKPFKTRWRHVFPRPSTGEERNAWHEEAFRIYGSSKKPIGFYHATGLGLTDEMMQPLQTMRNNSIRRNWDTIRRLPEYRGKILEHVKTQRPDKAGKWTPDKIADRRVELLRVYLLAGKSQTRAVAYLRLLTGEVLSRQAYAEHLREIREATGLRSLPKGNRP